MKKGYKILVASALTTSIVAPVAAVNADFNDVSVDNPHYEAIQALANRGVIKGYSSDNTFRPYNEVTRGQAAKMIAGALGYDTTNVSNPNFKDVPTTHEFYGAIAALANHGIINGYASTQTFNPHAPMTRQQMAKVIARAFDLKASTQALPFTDVKGEFTDYIAALFEHGITTGTTATTFSGGNNVKRGQLASFIYRAENAQLPGENEVEENKVIDGTITTVSEDGITIGGNVYDVSATLRGLLNKENDAALAGASIQGTVEDGTIVSLTSLTIKAEGTKENPIILQGVEAPVASVTPMAAAVEIGTKLTLDTPFVEVKNLKLSEVNVTSKVQDLKLNAMIAKLVIEKDVAATIHGDASITEVQVNSEKVMELAIQGTISTINVKVTKAIIKLGLSTKVTDIVTNGAAISNVISNYQAVRSNITNVNGTTPSSSSTSSMDNSSYGDSITQTVPSSQAISGVVSASTADTVTINNVTYSIDSSLAGLFSNGVLENANIAATVQNNKVINVTALTIKKAGVLDGKGVAINGTLTVDVDGLSVNNLTVAGDVKLTGNVQTAIDFNKVDIKGSLVAEETKTADLRNMRVASLAPIMAAENPVTRLKITFANSTVAFVEIKKIDTQLNIHGATQISILSLESNGSIFADPEVVLPNLKISKGVTHIELNASIASVEIDTNDDIQITGKGNFDSVKVKTDKVVVIKTEGTIKELASDTTNIQLGSNLKVQDTKTLAGDTKPAEDMITNFEEVKNNVNVEIKDDELEDYIAAKIIPVEGRFGYATLSVLNADKYTVKYRLVPHYKEGDLVAVGQKVPTNAIVYNKGDQFIPWFTSDIQVYTVDENDVIKDAYEIQAFGTSGLQLTTFDVIDNKIIFKTVFGQLPITSEFMFFVNGSQFFMPEDLSNYEWKADKDGIPTIEIPLPAGFAYKAEDYAFMRYHLNVKENEQQGSSGLYSYDQKGDYSKRDVAYLEALYQLAQLYTGDDSNLSWNVRASIDSLLHSFAYELEPVHDLDGKYLYSNHKPLTSTIDFVIDQYIEKLKVQSYTSGEDVKAMVLEVNEANKTLITQVKEAENAVNALFVEDYYQYNNDLERLAPTTTLQQIEAAEKLVVTLPDNNLKEQYLSLIQNAKYILKQLKTSTVTLTNIAVGEMNTADLLTINTDALIFEEDASILHYGTNNIKFESVEQLKTQLENWGYTVSFKDPLLIATVPADATTIDVTTGTISNASTSGDTVTIDTTALKGASKINLTGTPSTYTYVKFYEELKNKFKGTISKNNGQLSIYTSNLTEQDIFDLNIVKLVVQENVQEVTLTFSEALQEGRTLSLEFDGIETGRNYSNSTATVSDNTVKVIIRTDSANTPGYVTINDILDIDGNMVQVDHIQIVNR